MTGAARMMSRALADLPAEWQPLFQERPTFAATLLEGRKTFKQIGRECPPAVNSLLAMNLAAGFPTDCANYARLFSQAPALFVTMPDLAALKQSIDSKITGITRLSEYMPLTDTQWAQCSAEQRRQWQTVKTWTVRLAADSTAGDDEKLAAMLLDAASIEWPKMPERPTAEAVAPYVLPATPEARSFSKEEARAAIERDWLRQVGDNPDPAREIARTKALAARLGLTADGLDAIAAEVAKAPLSAEKARQLYLDVRRIRRALMLRNPVVDFAQLLLVDMPFPAGFGVAARDAASAGLHGRARRAAAGARRAAAGRQAHATHAAGAAARLLLAARPLLRRAEGAVLLQAAQREVVSPLRNQRGRLRPAPAHRRPLRRPRPDLPARRRTSSSAPRAATPTCAACRRPTPIVLARCDPDGSNIYLISANNEPDYLPSVMNDGRIVYTRWEYTDKPLWRAQKLWTINPDGTQVLHVLGQPERLARSGEGRARASRAAGG